MVSAATESSQSRKRAKAAAYLHARITDSARCMHKFVVQLGRNRDGPRNLPDREEFFCKIFAFGLETSESTLKTLGFV
jgi:hypothetical protein